VSRPDPDALADPERRRWLRTAAGACGALLWGTGCRPARVRPGKPPDDAETPPDGPEDAAERAFPLLDVSAEPHAFGLAIGRRFRTRAWEAFARYRTRDEALRAFALGDGRAPYERMVEAVRRRFPALIEEVRGMAEGFGVPFDDLLALHCRPELEAIRDAPGGGDGCATVAVVAGGRALLAHDEDADERLEDLPYLVRTRPAGGVGFVGLCRPGLLPGSGPALNDRGLCLVADAIPARAWRPGVPRAFLARAALEARTIEEAVEILAHHDRAGAAHHLLAAPARPAARAVAVEMSATRSEIREIEGLYVHTNHFVLDSLRPTTPTSSPGAESSRARLRTLEAAGAARGPLERWTLDDALAAISSHGRDGEAAVCRHPGGGIATIAAVLFEVGRGRMRVFRGPPCRGLFEDYRAPDPTATARDEGPSFPDVRSPGRRPATRGTPPA
jgi:hypothetical protein